jgi:hypothetical protein
MIGGRYVTLFPFRVSSTVLADCVVSPGWCSGSRALAHPLHAHDAADLGARGLVGLHREQRHDEVMVGSPCRW